MKWLLLALLVVALVVVGALVGRRGSPAPVDAVSPSSSSSSSSSVGRRESPPIAPGQPLPPAPIQVEQLALKALEAYGKGQYPLAIQLANQALALNEHHPMALHALGAANCKIKNREAAMAAMAKAQPQSREFIKTVCQKEGIQIP